ncbi:MAG: hypothetical protein ACOC2E_06795 [Bacteroidota bacterium]
MQRKRKKVLCINSESSFLEQQKKELRYKNLDDNLISFNNLSDAFRFIETQIIEKNEKVHYIILDESIVSKHLTRSLDKFWGLNHFLKKPDVIIVTEENNAFLRNRVMQYPFVAAFLVKPIPSSYIEFLITGQPS